MPGKFDIKPKKAALLNQYKDEKVRARRAALQIRVQCCAAARALTCASAPCSQDLTKMINANNESNIASKAQQSGGHLAVVSAASQAPQLSPLQTRCRARPDAAACTCSRRPCAQVKAPVLAPADQKQKAKQQKKAKAAEADGS